MVEETGPGAPAVEEPRLEHADYVPEKPADWSVDSCAHFWDLDRLQQRPHKKRGGYVYFFATCPWCRQTATLDQILTAMFRGLSSRVETVETEQQVILDQLAGPPEEGA